MRLFENVNTVVMGWLVKRIENYTNYPVQQSGIITQNNELKKEQY